jgi:hypothetical protein
MDAISPESGMRGDAIPRNIGVPVNAFAYGHIHPINPDAKLTEDNEPSPDHECKLLFDSQTRMSNGQPLVESYVRGTDAQVNKLSFGKASFGICFLKFTFDKVDVIPVGATPTTPVALP